MGCYAVTRERGSRWKAILAAASAAALVAALGATVTELGSWYRSLEKPWWQPPDWLFGPAWTVIFGFAAISAATAWRHAPDRASREWVIGLFSLNGLLNILWSVLFFRMHRPDWALFEVVLLWMSILLIMLVVGRYSKMASWFLLPYLAWVTFAGILNLEVVRLNPAFSPL